MVCCKALYQPHVAEPEKDSRSTRVKERKQPVSEERFDTT